MKRIGILALFLASYFSSLGQIELGRYKTDGYYSQNFIDSKNFVTCDYDVYIYKRGINIIDSNSDSLIFCMKKRTKAGLGIRRTRPIYKVFTENGKIIKSWTWKIKKGLIVLYEKDNYLYLSKFSLNKLKLPNEYITYRIISKQKLLKTTLFEYK